MAWIAHLVEVIRQTPTFLMCAMSISVNNGMMSFAKLTAISRSLLSLTCWMSAAEWGAPPGSLLDEYPVLASGFRPAHPLAPVKTLARSLVPGPWPPSGLCCVGRSQHVYV